MRHLQMTCTLLGMLLVLGCHKHSQAQDLSPQGAAPRNVTAPPPASAVPAPAPWPRVFTQGVASLELYQPQVDSWTNYAKIKFRAALALSVNGAAPQFGVLDVSADTLVDHQARVVILTNLNPSLRFPGMDDANEAALVVLAKTCLPKKDVITAGLDEVLAYMPVDNSNVRTADVNLAPPPIYYSETPAILVTFMGQPQFKEVKDARLMFAANTNWPVLMDMASAQYYLLADGLWLTAPDPLKGPWTAAKSLPAEIAKLPDTEQWKDVRHALPLKAAASAPRVITSTEPAELIVTRGEPQFTPIPGTRLMYVSNPDMPLFLDLSGGKFYFLVSGRWFSAADLKGPWTAASASLPAEFAKIPTDSEMGFVLASVPKTQEAQDAVLLASVPHKATVNVKETKVEVIYDGKPKFEPITGTSMTYAVNTPFQVICVEGKYYCCNQGVWFISKSAGGPWKVATSIPQVIYTIPASSPVYNVTYVQIYDTTPDTVVVGYTGGYTGQYVAATGVLMFGAGVAVGAIMANNCYYHPCYYSYGCAVHYSYAYGGYYRAGGACYGPYGGAGWSGYYNSNTGGWARAGYAYGPNGARWGGEAYNPFTNTYGAHAGGTNGYQSWGKSVVSHDGEWAKAGHVSGQNGSAGYVADSKGQHAGYIKTDNGGGAVKTGNGDVYAGKDGNVYRKDQNGQWQKYEGNGNWSNPAWNKPSQVPAQTAAENAGKYGQQAAANQGKYAQQAAANEGKYASQRPANTESGSRWNQQETARSLNSDSWARQRGSSNASSSWESRLNNERNFNSDRFGSSSDRFGGGSDRFGGSSFGGDRFGGGGFGGSDRFGGGRFSGGGGFGGGGFGRGRR